MWNSKCRNIYNSMTTPCTECFWKNGCGLKDLGLNAECKSFTTKEKLREQDLYPHDKQD